MSSDEIVQKAISFLKAPSLSGTPLDEKLKFLKGKGLSDDQIQQTLLHYEAQDIARVNGTDDQKSSNSLPEQKPLVPPRPDFITSPSANQPLTVEHYNHLHKLMQEQNRHVELLASGQHWIPKPPTVELSVFKHRAPFWRSVFWMLSLLGIFVGGTAFILRSCLARLANKLIHVQASKRQVIVDLLKKTANLAKAQLGMEKTSKLLTDGSAEASKDPAPSNTLQSLKNDLSGITDELDKIADSLDKASGSIKSHDAQKALAESAGEKKDTEDKTAAEWLSEIKSKISTVTTNLTMEIYMNSSIPTISPTTNAPLADENEDGSSEEANFSKVCESQREQVLETVSTIKKDIRGLKGLLLNRRNFLAGVGSSEATLGNDNVDSAEA